MAAERCECEHCGGAGYLLAEWWAVRQYQDGTDWLGPYPTRAEAEAQCCESREYTMDVEARFVKPGDADEPGPAEVPAGAARANRRSVRAAPPAFRPPFKLHYRYQDCSEYADAATLEEARKAVQELQADTFNHRTVLLTVHDADGRVVMRNR